MRVWVRARLRGVCLCICACKGVCVIKHILMLLNATDLEIKVYFANHDSVKAYYRL